MKKPSLLFVDHMFHKKTQSFKFLETILQKKFKLERVYVDPEAPIDFEQLESDAEYVLLAQMDFLTPFFLLRRKRVIVVPMYDGSAGLPNLHWTVNRQASYLNFSRSLHSRALALGCRSKSLKYYPDPAKFEPVEDFESLRAFFWQRLPESLVNFERVSNLLGSTIDKMHIHLPTDDGSKPVVPKAGKLDYKLSTSTWFKQQSDYLDTLNSSNIFVAPRIAEGIGHAFLEAMARGMVVLAYDLPTHSEYIRNFDTGILFNEASTELDLQNDVLKRIGAGARGSVEFGYAIWKTAAREICDFIIETPKAELPDSAAIHNKVQRLIEAYQDDLSAYDGELNASKTLNLIFSNWRDEIVVSEKEVQETESVTSENSHTFAFGYANGNRYLQSGWSDEENGYQWSVSKECSMQLKLPKRVKKMRKLVLVARALQSKPIAIAINGVPIGSARISTKFEQVEFDLDIDATEQMQVDFMVPSLQRVSGDPRSFSFCLKSLHVCY